MENIRKLEIHRLIKELDYIKSDLNYKSEILSNIDIEFIKNVNIFLEKHPSLKEVFEDKVNTKDNFKVDESQDTLVDIEDIKPIDEEIYRNPKIKDLYRSIVKSTHPDKLGNDILKDLYIEASIAYENNNMLPIFTICDRLMIPYELSDEETILIKSEINSLRDRVSFLETTFTWQWYNQDSESIKERVILSYIKAQLIK